MNNSKFILELDSELTVESRIEYVKRVQKQIEQKLKELYEEKLQKEAKLNSRQTNIFSDTTTDNLLCDPGSRNADHDG